MNSFRHLLCLRGARRDPASGCGAPHGQPSKDSEVLAPNEILEFGTLYAENCAAATVRTDGRSSDRACQSCLPGHRRRCVHPQSHRQRRARNRDAGLRPKRRRNVDGRADRRDHQGNSLALEQAGNSGRGHRSFLCAEISRRRRSAAKSHTRPTASLATVPAVAVDAKPAPLRMILFLRSSAIKDCARSSSPAALNWERRTGAETYPANRCPIRKSPT